MGIALRDVGVGHVRVGDHRLVDQVEIDHHLGGVFGIGVGRQRRLLAGPDLGDPRIAQIRSGEKPALAPDANAKYAAEVVIDLDLIDEPMIADPDVTNADISKRYTHDTIRPISFYGAEKKVDLGFVGSCMVHKGDVKIVATIFTSPLCTMQDPTKPRSTFFSAP